MDTKLGICFKGGLARGFGAIGCIRYFQEEGIVPYVVAGSSSGSLMAAIMAMQIPWQRAQEITENINFLKLVSPTRFFERGALVPYEKMAKLFTDNLPEIDPNMNIEDLPIKLIVFVTDPETQQRVPITKGNLRDALICSCGYPVIFENIKLNGKLYLDGDLTPGFYPEVLKEAGATRVIGISTSPKDKKYHQVKRNSLNKVFEIFRIYMHQAVSLHDMFEPVDLRISYNVGDYSYFDFLHIDRIINRAYQATKRHAQEILKVAKYSLQ